MYGPSRASFGYLDQREVLVIREERYHESRVGSQKKSAAVNHILEEVKNHVEVIVASGSIYNDDEESKEIQL